MQHKAAPVLDRAAKMDADVSLGRTGLDSELFQKRRKPQIRCRLVHDEAHRAFL